jgi:hypothetical protein
VIYSQIKDFVPVLFCHSSCMTSEKLNNLYLCRRKFWPIVSEMTCNGNNLKGFLLSSKSTHCSSHYFISIYIMFSFFFGWLIFSIKPKSKDQVNLTSLEFCIRLLCIKLTFLKQIRSLKNVIGKQKESSEHKAVILYKVYVSGYRLCILFFFLCKYCSMS